MVRTDCIKWIFIYSSPSVSQFKVLVRSISTHIAYLLHISKRAHTHFTHTIIAQYFAVITRINITPRPASAHPTIITHIKHTHMHSNIVSHESHTDPNSAIKPDDGGNMEMPHLQRKHVIIIYSLMFNTIALMGRMTIRLWVIYKNDQVVA